MLLTNKIHFGDNLEILKTLPPASVDAIITDAPYGLGREPDAARCLQDWITHGYHDIKGRGFMGKTWDAFVPQPVLWKECFRVLKPGGHLLSFFGTRTYDWGTLSIRLAGFEIRDCIMWVYGSGFPKSLDISKAIDKAAGAERQVVGKKTGPASRPLPNIKGGNYMGGGKELLDLSNLTAPATAEAKQWAGYGTALKPACEPICVARKPLEGTVIENVLKHGTGGINIDAGRVETTETWAGVKGGKPETVNVYGPLLNQERSGSHEGGRFPANLIHDGSDEVLQGFPYTKSGERKETDNRKAGYGNDIPAGVYGKYKDVPQASPKSEGSAARFFYSAKASTKERAGRKHPTIKPLSLMEYLVQVYCPPGAVCLDPFLGSGTTAAACINTGRDFIGMEADPEHFREAQNYISELYYGGL